MIKPHARVQVSGLKLVRRARPRVPIRNNPPIAAASPVAELLPERWWGVYAEQAARDSADVAMAALGCCPAACQVCGDRLYVLTGSTGPYRCGRCQPAYGDPDAVL
jgi:hypothetical protein